VEISEASAVRRSAPQRGEPGIGRDFCRGIAAHVTSPAQPSQGGSSLAEGFEGDRQVLGLDLVDVRSRDRQLGPSKGNPIAPGIEFGQERRRFGTAFGANPSEVAEALRGPGAVADRLIGEAKRFVRVRPLR